MLKDFAIKYAFNSVILFTLFYFLIPFFIRILDGDVIGETTPAGALLTIGLFTGLAFFYTLFTLKKDFRKLVFYNIVVGVVLSFIVALFVTGLAHLLY